MTEHKESDLDWMYEVMAESDRGGVLVACAMIEEKLTELLKAHFVDDPKVFSSLTHSSGPLGAFSTKIKLTYLLGLIDAGIFRELEVIRSIRNDFAHKHFSLDFSTPSVRDRMATIAQDRIAVSGADDLTVYPITIKATGQPTSRKMDKEYWRFVMIVGSLVGSIDDRIKQAEQAR